MDITVLVSSSPIKSHPDTRIIDETLTSIRQRLPSSRIIVMQDGVRSEQQNLRGEYEEYLTRLQKKYQDIEIVISQEHKHQARMTRDCLKLVETPLIFYVEHDMPLCEDIPFNEMSELILGGQANVVRLMFEAHILEVHQYLMCGKVGNYTKTIQWSQRPHLAKTEFYRHLLNHYFSDKSNTYIEDKIFGEVSGRPWEDFKVMIYTPEGDNKRSYTNDGREDGEKYDDRLIY